MKSESKVNYFCDDFLNLLFANIFRSHWHSFLLFSPLMKEDTIF